MELDREQKQAVEATGSNIIVSASAGAGKTGVLVQRLTKRIITDHIRVSRILALTFTSAAASEMKKRLAGSLHDAFLSCKEDVQKEWLRTQLIELEATNITTIDSYCLTLIKKYYPVIALDPSTCRSILSAGRKNLYLRASYHEALEHLIMRDEEKALHLLEYFSSRSEDYDSLETIIDSINTHAQSTISPDTWYRQAADSYHHIDHLHDLPPMILDTFYESFICKLSTILSSLEKMEGYGANDPKVDPDLIHAKRNSTINCIHACEEQNYGLYSASLENLASIKTSSGTKDNTPYKEARKKVEETIKKLLKDNYDEEMLVHDHNDLEEITHTLISLCKETWSVFTASKRKDAVMDFTDMERYAFDILNANDKTVASILKDQFDEIMVDEFQDTSDLQNAIIDLISNGHNVFRVGDVKQSIYRFRQAKPSLMRDLMKDENTTQITLRHNFRSMFSIVEFSNHLFTKLMNIEGCSDSYSETDTVSIGSKRQKEDLIPVEFALIRIDKKEENEEEESLPSKQQKATWIAKKILQMKREDPSLSFKDFCILVRSHADKAFLRIAFDRFNIPYNIDAREGFYQSELAQILLSLFHAINDPSDPIAMLASLTSFYRFSDEELAQLKIRHDSILEGIESERPDILEELHELRTIAEEKGLEELLTAISIRHDFYNTLSSSQKANFDYLFETVCNTHFYGLEDLLEVLDASEDEKSSEAISIGKDDDVVNVTTIHQSKGLQYGIVFLWSTSQNYFRDGRNAVVIDDTLRLGIRHLTMPMRMQRNTVQRIAVEYHANIEDAEEFIRLLYVAITRAEKRLFIVDTIKKDWVYQPTDLSLLTERKGMTSLILNALKDDPICIVNDVEEEDIEKQSEQKKEYVSVLPHLSFSPSRLSPILTPSSTEFHTLPPLDNSSRTSGTSYGTRMHVIMESLPDRSWTEEDLQDLDLSIHDKQKILSFSSSAIYQKALSMKIHKEYPFYIHTENERITGEMDFVAISETEIILIDYKTDHAEAAELLERYMPQINTYRRALQYMYPSHTIHAYIFSFHLASFIEI